MSEKYREHLLTENDKVFIDKSIEYNLIIHKQDSSTFSTIESSSFRIIIQNHPSGTSISVTSTTTDSTTSPTDSPTTDTDYNSDVMIIDCPRKLGSHAKKQSYQLLNTIPVPKALKLYKKEIENYSKKLKNDPFCLVSTRVTKDKQYPRIQIPESMIIKYCNCFYRYGKGSWKVNVSHLAWRAMGNLLLPYTDGYDIVHTCHNGSVKDSKKKISGCIDSDHINIATHKENMDSQRCIVSVKCICGCDKTIDVCNHNPKCIKGG